MGLMNMWPLFGYSSRASRTGGASTADGGKIAPIDLMVDNDGPIPKHSEMKMARDKAEDDRLRARKEFCVTEATRLGGDGLYEPDKE